MRSGSFGDQVVADPRAASLAGGVAAFNEDKFTAGEVDVDAVISAARTVPMMASRRFVLLRGAERWDASDGETSPFDRLAEYAAAPVDTACLVIVATKLDGRRKFAQVARKQGFLVMLRSARCPRPAGMDCRAVRAPKGTRSIET